MWVLLLTIFFFGTGITNARFVCGKVESVIKELRIIIILVIIIIIVIIYIIILLCVSSYDDDDGVCNHE